MEELALQEEIISTADVLLLTLESTAQRKDKVRVSMTNNNDFESIKCTLSNRYIACTKKYTATQLKFVICASVTFLKIFFII